MPMLDVSGTRLHCEDSGGTGVPVGDRSVTIERCYDDAVAVIERLGVAQLPGHLR